jgi:hypothetical protein
VRTFEIRGDRESGENAFPIYGRQAVKEEARKKCVPDLWMIKIKVKTMPIS